MKIVILAGGLGERLRPLTYSIPKPLLPIGEKPILEILLSKLKQFGLDNILICLGYKSEIIENYFQDGRKFGVNITYLKEKKRLGTAGPLRLVQEKLSTHDKNILVVNGDILTKLNFNEMINFHDNSNAAITIGTVSKRFKIKYGLLEIENGQLIALKEKPHFNFDVNAGIYVINTNLIELIPNNEHYNITDLIIQCIKMNKKILAYPIKECWLAIDKIKDLDEAVKNIDKYLGKN